MITIHKYVASIHDYNKPQKTSKIIKVLNVKEYEDHPELIYVWAIVDDLVEQETIFNIIGTGHEVPKFTIYCGTVVTAVGLVWHLFVPWEQIVTASFSESIR